ncbi:MAG: HD-GYP domain-containing protein [Treponema sp.]|jgi:HD-GYP domain-containing protein (c-di-GMP phosphodiesterase class II)|nr:HD-GYP domain-containing protein [Treponema sp.]
MNVIYTTDLRPGQVFSAPVFTEGEYLLVTARIPLRQKDIDLLHSCGLEFVKTEGAVMPEEALKEELDSMIGELLAEDSPMDLTEIDSPAEASPLADLPMADFSTEDSPSEDLPSIDFKEPESLPDDFATDDLPPTEGLPGVGERKANIKFSISDVQQNSGPYRAYKSLIEKLNSIYVRLKGGDDIEMRAIDNISVQLLRDLRDNPDSFVGFILGGEVSGNELAKSSVNTAILSALMAQELKLPHHKIHNIVSGALLHDIGMLRLSKGITEKKGGLSEAELEQIKSHPSHSSKIITKELFGPQEVNVISLQHHERWDGQGYPNSLSGQAIDIGARVVSVADAFEAMVSKKSYRNSIVGYQAIKNLLADNARRFDPAVIISFTKIMGIYPIGSIVKLNDSSIARVINVNTDAPLRPVIQLLTDKNGNVFTSKDVVIIDLLEKRTLFIKEAIDPIEYAKRED